MLFKIAFYVYLASMLCYAAYLFNRKAGAGKVATTLLVCGLLVHTASLVVRSDAANRPPFLNLYEYTLSCLWGVSLVYLVTEFKTKNRDVGVFVTPLIALFSFMALQLPTEVNPTMPALRSAWRVPHIATAIFAYAAFGVAFGMAIMYHIQDRVEGKKNSFWANRLPDKKNIDKAIYRMIAFGFMMQTALLITGAIWAQFAWGRYWGWDPKETWALVTWLIYAAFLHTRVTMGWTGRKSATMVIVGFFVMIFTLIGVNWLGGLHAYGKIMGN